MFEANLSAYVVAATLIMISPGPANMLMMLRGASSLKAGLVALAGLMMANTAMLGAAILGISALVLQYQAAFIALKIAGALYLAYVGVRILRQSGAPLEYPPPSSKGALDGFLTGVTNPKALIFYVAFLPQFVTAGAPVRLQLIGLGLVDLLLAAIVFGSYVLAGSAMMRLLLRRRVRAWFDRCIDSVMIGSATLVLRTAHPSE